MKERERRKVMEKDTETQKSFYFSKTCTSPFSLISNHLSFPPFLSPLNALHLSWLLFLPAFLQSTPLIFRLRQAVYQTRIVAQAWFLLTALPIYSSIFSVQESTALLLLSLSHTHPEAGEERSAWKIAMSAKQQKKKRGKEKGMRGSQMNGWRKDGREKMSNQKWNNRNIHTCSTHTHTHALSLFLHDGPQQSIMLMLPLNICAA